MASEAAEPPLFLSPEQEGFELSTTVDPSYIIQLIRQLLPANNNTKDLERQLSGNVQNAVVELLVDEGKDREARNSEQCETKGSHFSKASMDMAECNREIVQQADVCENVGCQVSHKENQGLQTFSSNSDAPDCGKNVEESSFNETDHSPLGLRDACRTSEEQREEAGCMLWDLAATQSHAEFMVKNHVLDVLLAILGVPNSDRIREICLGILGNLACHAEPVKAIVETSGLSKEIMQSLFVDDAPSLSEACRLLSASLHSDEVDSWVKAIDSREVLERVMWIAANTMNSLLLEKSTELLLAMVDCQGSSSSVLLSSLVRLGLSAVVTDLLASEISAFIEGTCSHGNVVLDTVLQIAEALSLADDAAGQLAENSKLFTLACQVIQLSGKDEVGPAGITATVLVANLLAEKEELIHEVAQDVALIKQLLDLLPSAADDPGARNAFWSILGRLSLETASYSTSSAVSTELSLTFAHGSRVLLEDLQEHQDIEDLEEVDTARGYTAKLETVDSLLRVMDDWLTANDSLKEENEAHKTITRCCSAVKSWLSSVELDKTLQSSQNHSLENGTRETD